MKSLEKQVALQYIWTPDICRMERIRNRKRKYRKEGEIGKNL